MTVADVAIVIFIASAVAVIYAGLGWIYYAGLARVRQWRVRREFRRAAREWVDAQDPWSWP